MTDRQPDQDLAHLRRALRLAERGRYRVAPNPMVGAVVVAAGEVVGEGWHRQLGGPHAEVEALAAAGEKARGGSLYVTLEPCAHWGRTPPCVDAVIAAGLAKVVVAGVDPDPRTAGAGLAGLQAAGVVVVMATDLGRAGRHLRDAAAELNLRFLIPHRCGRPAVTLKWAMSLDGKTATVAGDSRWISSPAARRFNLALREEHDAIVVGSGTVVADNPRLDRRLGLAVGPILRVVLDRRLRLRPSAALFEIPGPVLVFTAAVPDGDGECERLRRIAALRQAGAEVVELTTGGVAEVLSVLGQRGVQSVLVEGGGEVAAAFVDAGLYDRVITNLAPLLIGGRQAPTPLGGAGRERLAGAPRLAGLRTHRRGGDIILEGLRDGCLQDLSTNAAGC